MKRLILAVILSLSCVTLFAQHKHNHSFTKADTLRGTLNEMRDWYDVYFYDLQIKVNPTDKTIQGYNDIYFKVLRPETVMQIDLFDNLAVDSIVVNGTVLDYTREHHAVFVTLPEAFEKGSLQQLTFHYSGTPQVAKRPPWDGGFTWSKDDNDHDWIGVSCQELGASVWWPNKDHQTEEPDSMRIGCAVPNDLMCVANGNLREKTEEGDYTRYQWFVSYPINNYCVSVNIADYVHFEDVYKSGDDELALDYYVLPYNLDKAKKQFEQVKPMMACFEEMLGRYPFWDDGFALVETPYLGMEHQSAIAYGNKYLTGYNGTDFSRIGLDFDYIIIHEAGHEWWGNSITSNDIADMWIHEGFCTYSEALYVECMFDYEKAMDYVNAKKDWVDNLSTMIGPYGVNTPGKDVYNKGMLLLNTLRHVIADDDTWFSIIKGLLKDFHISTVSTDEIEQYISKKSGKDLSKIFEQYLRHVNIPVLEYNTTRRGKYLAVNYRWQTDVEGFDMPFKYKDKSGTWQTIQPTNEWQSLKIKKMDPRDFEWGDRWFYVNTDEVKK